jgi:serine/threonine protein kinase
VGILLLTCISLSYNEEQFRTPRAKHSQYLSTRSTSLLDPPTDKEEMPDLYHKQQSEFAEMVQQTDLTEFSALFKEFLRLCLCMDYEKRLRPRELLAHAVFQSAEVGQKPPESVAREEMEQMYEKARLQIGNWEQLAVLRTEDTGHVMDRLPTFVRIHKPD